MYKALEWFTMIDGLPSIGFLLNPPEIHLTMLASIVSVWISVGLHTGF